MAEDILNRLKKHTIKGRKKIDGRHRYCTWCDIIDEIEQLRAEVGRWVADFQDVFVLKCKADDEIERLLAERDAERALADRLAVALAAQGSASFDEDTNLTAAAHRQHQRHIKRLALDAFKEARRG